jgi:hypothetical protein
MIRKEGEDMALLFTVVLLQANPLIQEMVDSVSSDSILANVQRMQDFVTRYATHDSCFAAAEWICDKFVSYNMDSVYHDTFSFIFDVPDNIVGIKNGTVFPESCYTVICGHYDATALNPDLAPGADDNASGVAAVVEAARILKDYEFEYNIRFIAFSAEEFGIVGSGIYAWRASQRGDDIEAVFNFDMIGYADAQPETLEVCGDTFCTPLIAHFIACADTYTTLLTTPRLGCMVSDEEPFRFWGYPAIGMVEDLPIVNPYYHTQGDTIGGGFNDLAFCTEVTRAGVAALASSSRPVGLLERDYLAAKAQIYVEVSPNPFQGRTVIRYSTKNRGSIMMEIYDAAGRQVKSHSPPRSYSLIPYEVSWDGRDDEGNNLPSGVYFLKLTTENCCATMQLLLIR